MNPARRELFDYDLFYGFGFCAENKSQVLRSHSAQYWDWVMRVYSYRFEKNNSRISPL